MGDIYAKKLNWRRILEDLRERGTSVYRTAKILGRPETTVQSWQAGHEPSYSNGAAILQLHAAVCGEELTKLRCTEGIVYEEVKRESKSS